ncbi:MAG TPA: hypothetical protein VLH15_08780 [Dehalococcoidales bacterium]|nr:hypothetical protein [Dehalococcoidales bacterium]
MWEKSVAQKLMIKPGYKVLFVNSPDGYEKILGKLPENVDVLQNAERGIDFIQVFLSSQAELEAHLNTLTPLLKPEGVFWVSYPKISSGVAADINRNTINSYAAGIGLKGVAMIAVDNIWSALRLKIL